MDDSMFMYVMSCVMYGIMILWYIGMWIDNVCWIGMRGNVCALGPQLSWLLEICYVALCGWTAVGFDDTLHLELCVAWWWKLSWQLGCSLNVCVSVINGHGDWLNACSCHVCLNLIEVCCIVWMWICLVLLQHNDELWMLLVCVLTCTWLVCLEWHWMCV